MFTDMQETSLSAYNALKESGSMGKQCQTIMAYIERGTDYSLQELCKITGYPINVISGRCNDLKKTGSLVHGFKRKCRITGRTINPVKLPQKQEELF